MQDSFWHRLSRPFFALAPMEDVTDAAFRALIARHADPGVPRVFYTEFTSADGLVLADESGQRVLRRKLAYTPLERPIVAQLFTASPERMEAATRIIAALGFDGVDINMGCPDRAVERAGCGAALIKTPELACALIAAARRGACACASETCTSGTCMPVSVKTRLGYNTDELETWLPALLAQEPAAIALHARTRKELSDVPARWERVARAVELRDALGVSTRIIGNGDLRDLSDARTKAAATGADGAMLGRAVFGNPWLFSDREGAPIPEERIGALAEHLHLFETLCAGAHYATMKKHFKAYLAGWHGAKGLRATLMETECVAEALAILGRRV